eukprot:3770253-Rhodomonas_salina.1
MATAVAPVDKGWSGSWSQHVMPSLFFRFGHSLCWLLLLATANASFSLVLQVSPGRKWVEDIQNAPNGTRIQFSPGFYMGSCDTVVSKDLTLFGIEGSTQTTIDCNGTARHFRILNASVSIQGISLANGHAVSGGCVQVADSTLTLSDVTLENCTASQGGAVFAVVSTLNATNVTFQSNRAANGA